MAETGNQTFWDHLDALRVVLFRIAAVVIVAGVGSFIAMPWIFDNIILAPVNPDFITYRAFDTVTGADAVSESAFDVDLVSLQLASQFFIHMSASCWAAFLIGFPFIIYFLWSFISPGLYEHEKRGIRGVFFFGNILFFLGVAAGYFVVFPIALRFLSEYRLSDVIRPVVSLESYMENFFTVLILMGAVFELPLLAWFLGRIGVLTKTFFRKFRRHAIVALLIVAALITPTGDPFTLFAVFIPIYALWELSAFLVPAPDENIPDHETSP